MWSPECEARPAGEGGTKGHEGHHHGGSITSSSPRARLWRTTVVTQIMVLGKALFFSITILHLNNTTYSPKKCSFEFSIEDIVHNNSIYNLHHRLVPNLDAALNEEGSKPEEAGGEDNDAEPGPRAVGGEVLNDWVAPKVVQPMVPWSAEELFHGTSAQEEAQGSHHVELCQVHQIVSKGSKKGSTMDSSIEEK